jgi:hypothetical protein
MKVRVQKRALLPLMVCFIPEGSGYRYGDCNPYVLTPVTKFNFTYVEPQDDDDGENCMYLRMCIFFSVNSFDMLLKPKNVNDFVPLCMCVE